MLENEVDRGFIEEFLSQLPEKAFHLGLRVVLAGLAFLVGVQLIRILRHVIKKALGRSRIEESAMRFIDSFIKFGLYFVLILMIASSLGVDAASILAILGSASVAIGLAVQGSLSNFAGGVLLLILKPFMAGDYIKDGLGNEGTVDAVDIFYTQLVTPDNRVVVLPNGTLANGTITNFTRCRERRIDIPVGIAYDEDIRKAKEVIEAALRADAAVIADRDIMVFVDSLGESSVNLNARCWAVQEDFWPAKWRLTEAVKYALDEAGIRIPYPQVDVHLDK
ncbi:mechanosensitive ion channel family protein [bacterium 1xD8-48]|jgi:small conductance mechanosensitive channel|nr:mechanosensitive ion channel [Lachnospiraceae bacterium]MCI9326105.1 mechanosensitive ion channel [Lachnospiraceae bacterium]NBJ97304.1 mechanosensitive ion channel family protein [bacterium 1xD8-48]